MADTTPSQIKLHQKSRRLVLGYADGSEFEISCELLRVYSPSAEVRGHGPGQEVLQTGKMNVSIDEIKPVGNYAVQLVFDDGHDTGIFSWDYLFELGQFKDRFWDEYIARLDAEGANRDPDVQVVRIDL